MGSTAKKEWVVGYRRLLGDEYQKITPWKGSLGELTILSPEVGYYADPFVLEGYIFMEHFNGEKGLIVVFDTVTQSVRTIIDEPHHMSFPNVFKHEGEYYMVPEEGEIAKVRIWKATNFPYEWEPVHTIIGGGMHPGDTELFEWDGKWNLFTTSGNDHILYLLQSDSLLGSYQYVLEKEIQNSRPAGKMFIRNGMIFRPVQKCENQYGEKVIMKVVELNPYAERENPKEYSPWVTEMNGYHTFNFDHEFVVVDGRYEK